MDGSNTFDNSFVSMRAQMQKFVQDTFSKETELANVSRQSNQLARQVGACEAVMISAPDADMRRPMSPALQGYRTVIKTPFGGGDTMMELVSDNNDCNFSIPGSTMLAQRAHSNAGGISACQSGDTQTLSPMQTIIGGGCGSPPQVKYENTYYYAIDGDGDIGGVPSHYSGQWITRRECLPALIAELKVTYPTFQFTSLQKYELTGVGDIPTYDCGA